METVYDHNPTDEELQRLAITRNWQGNWPPTISESKRQDAHFKMIAALIGLRGGTPDNQYAYVKKIQDPIDRQTCTLALYEIGD